MNYAVGDTVYITYFAEMVTGIITDLDGYGGHIEVKFYYEGNYIIFPFLESDFMDMEGWSRRTVMELCDL